MVSFLIATVGSTFTSPTVVLGMLASFVATREPSCLRRSILEWTRAMRSEFFKVVVATVHKSRRKPRERLTHLQAFRFARATLFEEALLERTFASRVA